MLQTRVVIAVADDNERKKLRNKLVKAGHLVIAQVADAKETLRVTFQFHPDLVIFDTRLPDYGGLGVPQVIDEHRVAPIVFLAHDPRDIASMARTEWMLSYILVPYTDDELYLAIEVALANFRRLTALEQENTRLKRNVESRKLVERAKGLLMERKGFSERDAYKYIQKRSMDTSRSLAKVAREIIIQLESSDKK
ncbi:ANTAR domain-containing response regulator [Desulforudis sp. 1088]|uniref:ANTAR domain-containing response regulator n=1 Tax=unclassified Candidatus Desulforudis TaxID=2635950 RepID=UPI00348AEDFB